MAWDHNTPAVGIMSAAGMIGRGEGDSPSQNSATASSPGDGEPDAVGVATTLGRRQGRLMVATSRQRPTLRQVEVLRAYIAAGSIVGAAAQLEIAESTARQHLSGLYRRCGCSNATQAAYLLGRADTNGTGRVLTSWPEGYPGGCQLKHHARCCASRASAQSGSDGTRGSMDSSSQAIARLCESQMVP